jgi:RecA-family ATPase
MSKEVDIIRMSNVQAKEVDWLWYPYIPFGKITILEGDPGEGKTMVILAITALLSKGLSLPTTEAKEPITVIYQTADDGLEDTIKPRLEKMEANMKGLSLSMISTIL